MMREQEKLKKIKVLLIGDTHPEMIAIAKNLALNSIDFKIVLPTYFTVRESRILSNLGVRILGLGAWLQKRTLDSHINSDSIIRKYAFMETSTWLFKRMGYHRLSWKLADMYNKKLASQFLRHNKSSQARENQAHRNLSDVSSSNSERVT
jgi:hypothetical protein